MSNGDTDNYYSILDTDLYKLTMQQAVLEHFPSAQVRYRFNNRSKSQSFSRECLALFEHLVSQFPERALTGDEISWLKKKCPYFKDAYISYLSTFKFKPTEQVTITFVPLESAQNWGQIEIEVHGLWVETILYEIPLMATLSEAFFRTVDTAWTLEGQEELAYQKGLELLRNGVMLSEFGTRRRRSPETQRLVIEGLMRAQKELSGDPGIKGRLVGTSNVHFAHTCDLMPVGTIAHEWTMGIAALLGYATPNTTALSLWEATYPISIPSNAPLHTALTDTFGSTVFFREILASPDFARRWRGLRQDSGDPIEFAREAKRVYESLGIDVSTKRIVFSDALDVKRTLEIKRVNEEEIGFQASFGVGTSLTNDFNSTLTGEKSKALNIVIKLSEINGKPCVKLSDDMGKYTGDTDTIAHVKRELQLDNI